MVNLSVASGWQTRLPVRRREPGAVQAKHHRHADPHGPVRRSVFRATGSHGRSLPAHRRAGSVIALADSAGALIQQYHYGPYGEANANSAGITNPFQYTGRENDGDGLYYYRARYYSPELKRFISEDPIGFGGGQSNFYAYVGNNPISLIDPWGLQGWTPGTLPPPNIPGGPWSPAGPGQRPGDFFGPKKPTGPRDMCRYVPDENNGGPPGAKKPYWKILRPGEPWQRYNLEGDPISPEVAHPGDPIEPMDEPEPIVSPWLIGLYLLFYSSPAY